MFFVGVIFVSQAAFESAAAAGDFAGVERGFLQFGHFHGNGRHFAEVRVAADGFAAVAVVCQQPGFVADADLSHLNPQVEVTRQQPD